jgi:hypothetical protein
LGCNVNAENNIRANFMIDDELCVVLIEWQRANWAGHILRKNCHLNALLKGRYKEKEK